MRMRVGQRRTDAARTTRARCATRAEPSGAPKAVMLSHGGVCAATRAKLEVVGYDAGDTYLHVAPSVSRRWVVERARDARRGRESRVRE